MRTSIFCRVANLRAQRGTILTEEPLIPLILVHIQPQYQEHFKYKTFHNLKNLKDPFALCDNRGEKKLAHKCKIIISHTFIITSDPKRSKTKDSANYIYA